MKTTIRIGNGLAFNPDQDLALFADMAREGKRLTGISAIGHGWKFVDDTPEEVIFDIAYETNPTSDYFEIFQAAGWESVISYADLHIFKAAPGTAPLHTAIESRYEELRKKRNQFLRYSAFT